MNLTTVERVKLRVGIDNDDLQYDAMISSFVARISAEAERVMNRSAQTVARTTTFDLGRGQCSLSLPAFPISSVTDVRLDSSRVFGTDTVIDSTTYYTDTATGLLHMDVLPSVYGPGLVRVAYTGGMGASTEAFVAAYPDVAEAVTQRVAQLWQRRDEIGLTAVSGSQGSVSRIADDWSSDALDVLMRHRRPARQ